MNYKIKVFVKNDQKSPEKSPKIPSLKNFSINLAHKKTQTCALAHVSAVRPSAQLPRRSQRHSSTNYHEPDG
jgi:hypothetical protein